MWFSNLVSEYTQKELKAVVLGEALPLLWTLYPEILPGCYGKALRKILSWPSKSL